MDTVRNLDGVYHLDPAHSALGFTVRHAGLSRIRGAFDDCHGYAVIDRDDVSQSALLVRIGVASINTGVPDRDAHLCRDDFFDVASHPAIAYVGLGFEIVDDTHVDVTGDLTIKDVTRQITIGFDYTGGAVDPFGNRRIGFEAQHRILRSDYGLTWNAALETGGWLISDEVVLDLDVSAVQQARSASLVVDHDEIANLALGPTVETAPPEGSPEVPQAVDAPVRPRRGIVDEDPSGPEGRAAAQDSAGSGQSAVPKESVSEARGPWWRRITGR